MKRKWKNRESRKGNGNRKKTVERHENLEKTGDNKGRETAAKKNTPKT